MGFPASSARRAGALELRAVTHTLQIPCDDPYVRVIDESVAEVTELEIAFIARAYEISNAYTLLMGQRSDRGADGTALRHKCDGAGGNVVSVEHLADGRDDTVPEIDQANRIGTNNADILAERQSHQLALQLFASGPGLGEIGGKYERKTDLPWHCTLEQRWNALSCDGDDEQINGVPDGGQCGVAGTSHDLARFGAYRVDFPL